jgi:hypothetical protein
VEYPQPGQVWVNGVVFRMLNAQNQIRPIRLTEEQLRGLLDHLDGATTKPEKEVRRSDRISYRTLNVTIHVLSGTDQVSTSFQVPTRNLSASGLAFLHKQMLPIRQRLRIEIPMIDERILKVLAEVVRCRHVQGMVHEIGVRFQSLAEEAE